ncbi:MAG TPA: hypothetical protein VHY20_00885 [Pirellulales bacterium]|jgi:hypothetical protein|nr:hypothetical protein [Pirellulales bacterium]
MSALLPGCLLAALVSPQIIWGLLWFGLGVLTVALVTLMLTRWGQTQPLSKCIVLSVWAHLLMAVYASSVNIVFKPATLGPEIGVYISDVPGSAGETHDASTASPASEPWSQFAREAEARPSRPTLARPTAETAVAPPPAPVSSKSLLATAAVRLPEAHLALPEFKPPEASIAKTHSPLPAEALADHPAAEPEPAKPAAAPQPAASAADAVAKSAPPAAAATDTQTSRSAAAAQTAAPAPLDDAAGSGPAPAPATMAVAESAGLAAAASAPTPPASVVYSLRTAPDRAAVVHEQGGSALTEAAVKAALKWLADHQSADGRWDASLLESGRESKTLGQDRRGAGTEADMGMTGLALLTFLAAGHTHLAGQYQASVDRGLLFLVHNQSIDGNLGGRAEPYAFMYCHAMAGLALSEACGMTGDRRWLEPVKRGVTYTLLAQNRTTGGWRYRPQETGDTSQLGWQLMFLKSAELAGVAIPSGCRSGIERYLQTVASGRQGGLAAYRPGHAATHSMTAEALVCRLFLGHVTSPANDEAADYLVGELPGDADVNFYYWYYATLGLYQIHDARWRTWNQAVATQLVGRQSHDGDAAGSWDPDPVWGGYGGRVYSTALATLCLEVYYRFLPLYVEAAARGRNIK